MTEPLRNVELGPKPLGARGQSDRDPDPFNQDRSHSPESMKDEQSGLETNVFLGCLSHLHIHQNNKQHFSYV